MAVWIIAAGGKTDKSALANYSKTLSAPVSLERRERLEGKVALPSDDIYAWGFPDTPKGGNRRKIAEIKPGDVCFFCTTSTVGERRDWLNAYHWVARVRAKIDPDLHKEVSLAFWDSESFLPYLLERPIPISVSCEDFGKSIDPSGEFYVGSPQSSTKLADPAKLRHVISKYGSVDSWADAYIGTNAAIKAGGSSVVEVQGVSDASTPVTEPIDARLEKFCNVAVRPEQALFRRRLFMAYGGKCAVSGCSVVQALDAAHLFGRDWRKGHNNATDGILLRKDLHALYDSQLLKICEAGYVRMSGDAAISYPELEGVKVMSPVNDESV
ncbi:HNH endonuclease [Pseudomonas sp. p99-361]|uniref:HNH endonuclease n=1 Tax=Pseudomonas sp. p99-361 TaxID=2479852 RepID=UPI0013152A90|nr:HNH endonuclease [Pseudomonas sp. p99-361]